MFLSQLLSGLCASSRRPAQRLSVHRSSPFLEPLEQRCLLTINEFPTPTPISYPDFITAGPDGNVWFTENQANKIGQVTPSGLITEFPIPTPTSYPMGITTGPDGNIWFTENLGNKVGRIKPDGTQVTEFPLPESPNYPTQITVGPDGNLWFIEGSGLLFGRLDPSNGQLTEYRLNSVSQSLTSGPDGNLWFTEGSMIGRIAPDGSQVMNFPIPSGSALGITSGPDGNLWFTEPGANKIGRINPNNFSVREFPIPTANSQPDQITSGLDGNLWFTENNGNKIGRITVDGNVQEFTIPTSNSGPVAITSGPDGNIWFTEYLTNKIGEYVLDLPATHFSINAASTSAAGTPFGVTITALDAANRVVTGYTGTVHFTSSDPQGTLPADYTFTAADNGVHTFANGATLFTPGTQTVTATDTTSGITGGATITVTPRPPSTNHFVLGGPAAVEAGSSFDVVITALDFQGQIAKDYTGTVHFTSSDAYPGALPSDYTFTPGDNGVHTFSGLTLYTAGAQTVTAQDTADSSISGSATITVRSLSASQFLLTAPSNAVAGVTFQITVTALDPYGNVDTQYHHTIIITSSDRDPQPFEYSFTASDNGSHSLPVTLFSAALQTIAVRDASNDSIAGTAAVAVRAAPANRFLITAPASSVSGSSFDVIVTALDQYGNTDTNYQGAVHFTTTDSDPGVVLPGDYTFTTGDGGDNGVHAFLGGVALITPGLQSLFVIDTATHVFGTASVMVVPHPAAPPQGHGRGPRALILNVEQAAQQIALLGGLFGSLSVGDPTGHRGVTDAFFGGESVA